jgi:F-type H+-transporting ATPase subunit gamma
MAQLRDVKDRIESVKKTRKMTQAMKMVAASKFKRASNKALAFRPYLDELESLFKLSLSSADQSDILVSGNSSENEVVLLIAGDKGLCGGFNANILKFVDSYLKDRTNPVELYVLGNKGYQFFKSSPFKISKFVEKSIDQISLDETKEILDELTNRFKNGEIGKVSLLHSEFKSAVTTTQANKQLLPLSGESNEEPSNDSYVIEPDPESLFSTLSVDFLSLNLFRGILESIAAEQGARMAAMDAATDNAGDMIKGLTLEYNRQRQAQITTELSEIVAGAEALVS